VLFFDVSQLDPQGLREATRHAKRWVEETLGTGAEAMVVAHLRSSGVHELCPFVREPGPLIEALERLATGAAGADPFPADYGARLEMCRTGTVSCYHTGRKEYWQSRGSLQALLGFLTRMEDEPGRKMLLLFHRNLTMLPGRSYVAPLGRSGDHVDLVPDLIDLVDEVGAAATAARTEIYPLVVGGGGTWTVNLGANVADRSGGAYNRGEQDLYPVLRAAGRGCPCIYRLGLEPPGERSRVYRVKVVVNGRRLPHRQRAQVLTLEDRWARGAYAVLTNPEDAWKLRVSAGLVPGEREDGELTLTARVALDLADLEPGTREEGAAREWEVGALLAEQRETKTGQVWEMLGYASLPGGDALERPSPVVHERVFEGLRPGRYELRVWVFDRLGGTYGGARTEIELEGAAAARAAPERPAVAEGQRTATLPLRGRPDVIEVMSVRTPL
jgi:hypothetical protein